MYIYINRHMYIYIYIRRRPWRVTTTPKIRPQPPSSDPPFPIAPECDFPMLPQAPSSVHNASPAMPREPVETHHSASPPQPLSTSLSSVYNATPRTLPMRVPKVPWSLLEYP